MNITKKLDSKSEVKNIEIINILGSVISNYPITENKNEFEINLEDLEKGIYFIRLDNLYSLRFVRE